METETRIQDALLAPALHIAQDGVPQVQVDRLMHQHTSFVVAQRISTVLNADKIIVIDRGRVAAQGTHRELMQTSPIYQEIYESQLGNGFHPEEVAVSQERSVKK